jgi:hypothetical protein
MKAWLASCCSGLFSFFLLCFLSGEYLVGVLLFAKEETVHWLGPAGLSVVCVML